ncbi:pseudouridine synthase [Bacteriovoracaceae bacterium]|nr:pseudouridine synthase [Bacteriovoracaceae bacterium]
MRTAASNKYLLFNKPYGVLSQFTSDDGADLSQFNLPSDVYAVGRLDKDSEGLLLLSNDGKFQQSFLKNHSRVYWVQVDGDISEQAIHELQQGVLIKGGHKTLPCKVKKIANQEDVFGPRIPPVRFRKNIPTSWIEIELLEGKNRQVRRMTAKVGFPTLRLIRVGIGQYHLCDAEGRVAFKSGECISITLKSLI